jgi:type II secretory pathway component PulC
LYIPELVVKGIAKDTDGQMMAVVVGGANKRAYFLRENDQVFNGSVEKITSDSVIFREFASDTLGRESAHEVVKRIPKT